MFSVFQKASLILVVALVADVSVAISNQGRGGGDLCENRIKIIGADLREWILNGGARELDLQNVLSVKEYSQKMLAEISNAKIRCVSPGDLGYPVEVNGTPKVCVFDKHVSVGTVTCDSEKFNKVAESDQYILIHHEYAGISGIEEPQGDRSNYEISNQISGYLQDHLIKKLVVRPREGRSHYPTDQESVTQIPKGSKIRLDVSYNFPAKSFYIRVNGSRRIPNYTTGPKNHWCDLVVRSVSEQDRYLVPRVFTEFSVDTKRKYIHGYTAVIVTFPKDNAISRIDCFNYEPYDIVMSIGELREALADAGMKLELSPSKRF